MRMGVLFANIVRLDIGSMTVTVTVIGGIFRGMQAVLFVWKGSV